MGPDKLPLGSAQRRNPAGESQRLRAAAQWREAPPTVPRPWIAPEKLLRALLLQVLCTIRRERHRRVRAVVRMVDGLPTAWPWTHDRFRAEMSQPLLNDFEIR